MNHYELLIILPGKLSETEVPGAENTLRELCRTSGFTISREEPLGKRKLSYTIRGEQYGYYHTLEGDAEPETIKDLEKRLTNSPDILRHAIYEKLVKSQEAQERETKLRERVAHARATKAATTAARVSAETPATATTATVAAPQPTYTPMETVDVVALDKKLEELLEKPEGV
ncbi:MAG: 30S ribosomal protein S6 [bacterium]|nr:30S ribosomal protein S6 [bacterium]